MSLDSVLDKEVDAALEEVATAVCDGGRRRPMLVRLARLLARLHSRNKQLGDANDRLIARLIHQHIIIRELLSAPYCSIPEEMRARIDSLAPANVAPFTRRADLWAVLNRATCEIFAARDHEWAVTFVEAARMSNQAFDTNTRDMVIIQSPWPEAEHWRVLAQQEAKWSADLSNMLHAAMRQIQGLEARIDELRQGMDMPARPIRRGRIFTDRARSRRYVLLGNARGEGSKSGRVATVFRCARTSELFFCDAAEFSTALLPVRGE